MRLTKNTYLNWAYGTKIYVSCIRAAMTQVANRRTFPFSLHLREFFSCIEVDIEIESFLPSPISVLNFISF